MSDYLLIGNKYEHSSYAFIHFAHWSDLDAALYDFLKKPNPNTLPYQIGGFRVLNLIESVKMRRSDSSWDIPMPEIRGQYNGSDLSVYFYFDSYLASSLVYLKALEKVDLYNHNLHLVSGESRETPLMVCMKSNEYFF